MPHDNRRPPEQNNGLYSDSCRAYTLSGYGEYVEGYGTLKASGGDIGGGK